MRAKLADDVAGVAGGAISALVGVRREAEAMARSALEEMLRRLDLVTREEFEAVREMASRAREENGRLAARLAEVEARLARLEATPEAPPAVDGAAP
ncbi:accessory factor UbiK family protein [Elioraea sp. Yellowstone]|jgi:BMFP domain-containing protein YqiC|uniref:accessory factor UbiK family protein n=1 Tax=Elioraea sp. Yellowstone TaxID=2592070 RepID=UPI001150D1B4|nr:accessory factor UbiK family protein [Elioraea sp. Yellowstone]TQF78123.1 accessory factor UbiK family protein [Elioraea sp. Yellowstone]